MGHASIGTTMIYAHHVPKRDAADALTRLLDLDALPDGGNPEANAPGYVGGTTRCAADPTMRSTIVT